MNSTDCAPQLHQFKQTVERVIGEFSENRVCEKVDHGAFALDDYQKILRMIFHQVRESSFSFALASVNCAPHLRNAKEYLLHHADEEKLHWRWVLNDLQESGYASDSVESSLPLPACQNYISFNYYVALKMPIARLAIATVLEGIGARYGGEYAAKICKLLSLTPSQTQFYAGHGNTDREHIRDLLRVIEDCELSIDEWQWMNYAAETAGRLYRVMYEEALAN
jgi:heme oxygenase